MRVDLRAIMGWSFLVHAALCGAAPAEPASPPPPATQQSPYDGSSNGEAARHAKRTECVKQAKGKRLSGTAKRSYISSCVSGR